MTARLQRLLSQWYPQRDHCDWVLGTITDTQLSTYRKAGAMMLFNSLGEMYGMLSGGCLEGDLLHHARRALVLNEVQTLHYDLRDDSDSPWQKGLGCGGAVRIILQSVHADNHYLGLDRIHHQLAKGLTVDYWQRIDAPGLSAADWQVSSTEPPPSDTRLSVARQGQRWLHTCIRPVPHLLIFGGGADAVPLARLAQEIGWAVSVVDHRVNSARAEHFPNAHILRLTPEALCPDALTRPADAIVVMTHNLSLDAQALGFARRCQTRYVGLLGPSHRREKVEALAAVVPADFSGHYAGPVGLDIGAALPETIALSILAECHQVIEGRHR